MTTITREISTEPRIHVPDSLPAYERTGREHSGVQPFEAQKRCMEFLDTLRHRDGTEATKLQDLLFDQGDPQQNGGLTQEQAKAIAKQARRFDREGDVFARDEAELALNGSGLLLDEVRPRNVAEAMQADREGRRMRELRQLLLTESGNPDHLPF